MSNLWNMKHCRKITSQLHRNLSRLRDIRLTFSTIIDHQIVKCWNYRNLSFSTHLRKWPDIPSNQLETLWKDMKSHETVWFSKSVVKTITRGQNSASTKARQSLSSIEKTRLKIRRTMFPIKIHFKISSNVCQQNLSTFTVLSSHAIIDHLINKSGKFSRSIFYINMTTATHNRQSTYLSSLD